MRPAFNKCIPNFIKNDQSLQYKYIEFAKKNLKMTIWTCPTLTAN